MIRDTSEIWVPVTFPLLDVIFYVRSFVRKYYDFRHTTVPPVYVKIPFNVGELTVSRGST